MKPLNLAAALCAATLIPLSGSALGAGKGLDIGKREYESNCAVCHGMTGKGDGPYGAVLRTPMPDLTALAKNNGGVFPFARVYEAIDGRVVVRSHGPQDMPVWGRDYQAQAAPEYDDYPTEAEAFVRSRILALIDYLHRLQAR